MIKPTSASRICSRIGVARTLEIGVLIVLLTVLIGSWVTAHSETVHVDVGALQQQVQDNKFDMEAYKTAVHDRFDAQDAHLRNTDAEVEDLKQAEWWVRGGVGVAIFLQGAGLLRGFQRKEAR